MQRAWGGCSTSEALKGSPRTGLVMLSQDRSNRHSFDLTKANEIGFGLESTKNTLNDAELLKEAAVTPRPPISIPTDLFPMEVGGDAHRYLQCVPKFHQLSAGSSSEAMCTSAQGCSCASHGFDICQSDRDGVYRRCGVCLRVYTFGHSAINKLTKALSSTMPAFHRLAS